MPESSNHTSNKWVWYKLFAEINAVCVFLRKYKKPALKQQEYTNMTQERFLLK